MANEKNTSPVAIIAGISGGIGKEVAHQLEKKGFRIAGYGRSLERMREAVDGLTDPILIEADATDSEAVNHAFSKILEETGRVDAFVNCVGSITLKGAHMISDEEWYNSIKLNLDTAFFGLRAAVKPMQKAGGGSIVLISTVAACTGLPAHEAVAAPKAALHGLAHSAAATYASRGVRVNVVAPGMTETAMAKPILGSEQARKISEAMHPLGRIGQAEEVAALITHLLSDQASWITGQVFSIDGGLSTIHPRPKI